MLNDKIKKEITEQTLGVSTKAYKYAKVIYAYCTKEGVSEDLYELTPIMKTLKNMVEGMHINLLMLAGKQEYEEDMLTASNEME